MTCSVAFALGQTAFRAVVELIQETVALVAVNPRLSVQNFSHDLS